MDSNATIILLIYYVGIASCAAQGAEKGKYEKSIPIIYYIANAFGGGFMRDTIFLKVYPWLFTLSALPDITLVIITGFLYTYFFIICEPNKKTYRIVTQLIAFTDALGLGSFICKGMDQAWIYSNNIFTIIACGYITALGGGILASGSSFVKIFDNSKVVRYHLITLLGCCYYYVFRHSFCLICFITIGIFFTSIDYRTIYNLYPCKLITFIPEIFLLYPTICKKDNNFQRQKIFKVPKRFDIYSDFSKIYLIHRRIRQC